MTGKARRLTRIFGEDGRALVVPIDHPVTLGPIAGLESPGTAIAAMLDGGVDAMVVHRGVVTSGAWPSGAPAALIVHLSGGTELSGRPELKSEVCAVEDAVKLGADAVSVHISLGTERESEALCQLARAATACQEWGMPLLAMMYVYGDAATGPRTVVHAARIAAELGADCVKVSHPGDPEQLAELVEGCFCRVLIAGGARVEDSGQLLTTVEEAVGAGVAGFCIGRNAYQHPRPAQFTRALRAVIHDGKSAAEALGALHLQDTPAHAVREPHLV